MTSVTDVCNRMLQRLGTRTTVSDAELANNLSNESIQFNIMYTELRDTLLRLAPWNCAMKVANLTYITSQPGTPENTSAATNLWAPGQPAPPWSYEYQYPLDCLMPRWIIPSTQTGFAGGTPITTAVTGGASSWWWGTPVRFRVQTDAFYSVSAAAVAAGGSGYAVGDYITVALVPTVAGVTNKIGSFLAGAPQGAAVLLQVATIGGGGAVATATVISQINGEATPVGGSYFYDYGVNTGIAQGSTTGSGTGATFNLTFAPPAPQRVLLTNQEFATLTYTQQCSDPNLWDPSFRDAMYDIGAATLAMTLKGSRETANMLVQSANKRVMVARGNDGNEGLTVNDVTPDWIKVRGIDFDNQGMYSGPYQGYDWGATFPMF